MKDERSRMKDGKARRYQREESEEENKRRAGNTPWRLVGEERSDATSQQGSKEAEKQGNKRANWRDDGGVEGC
jgi:hypothetical protein